MNYKSINILGAALVGATGSTAVYAQDQSGPAVESLNGKLSFGYTHSSYATQGSGAFAVGSLAFPVTTSVGAQFDLGTDRLDTSANQMNGTNGVGLHVFTRDPSSYLIGVYGHVVKSKTAAGTLRNTRIGLEGEIYLSDYTVQGFIGQDRVSGLGTTDRFEAIDIAVSRFIGDNMIVSLGAERAFDNTDGFIGLEYMTSMSGPQTALFAEAGFGDSGTKLSAGVSVYLGSNGMSLKDVHRRNDPPSRLGSVARTGYFQSLTAGALSLPSKGSGKGR